VVVSAMGLTGWLAVIYFFRCVVRLMGGWVDVDWVADMCKKLNSSSSSSSRS